MGTLVEHAKAAATNALHKRFTLQAQAREKKVCRARSEPVWASLLMRRAGKLLCCRDCAVIVCVPLCRRTTLGGGATPPGVGYERVWEIGGMQSQGVSVVAIKRRTP
eukprot:354096-Chlamydomonas_euryale.AAC.4